MLVTCHQPLFLPWLPFFNRLLHSDVYLILDDFAYRKNYFTNRARIKDAHLNNLWMTIPVRRMTLGTPISEIPVLQFDPALRRSRNRMIEAYRGFSSSYSNRIISVLEAPPERLIDLNIELMEITISTLGMKKPNFVRISSLVPRREVDDRILAALKSLGASGVVIGMGGMATANDIGAWARSGITPHYQRPATSVIPDGGISIVHHITVDGLQATKKRLEDFWSPVKSSPTAHSAVLSIAGR